MQDYESKENPWRQIFATLRENSFHLSRNREITVRVSDCRAVSCHSAAFRSAP
jgi:hypothetical protein